MGLIFGRETADGYELSLLHRWLKPKISGNAINGLGETRARRPMPIYHQEHRNHPWGNHPWGWV